MLQVGLQSVSINLDAAISSVQATQSILKKFREDGTHFHKLFKAAETMCNCMSCEVPSLVNTCRRKVSRRLDQMWKNEQEFGILEEKMKVNYTIECWIT